MSIRQVRAAIFDTDTKGGTVYVARPGRIPTQRRAAPGPTTRQQPAVRIATDFAGMDMTAYAFKTAGLPVRHLFASEKDAAIREHLVRNHAIEHIYEDALSRPILEYRANHDDCSDTTWIDLYVAGPPCQPWSQNNVGANGIEDPRGQLFRASVEFIVGAKPRARTCAG